MWTSVYVATHLASSPTNISLFVCCCLPSKDHESEFKTHGSNLYARAAILGKAIARAIIRDGQVAKDKFKQLIGKSAAIPLPRIVDALVPDRSLLLHIDELDLYGGYYEDAAEAFYDLWTKLAELQPYQHLIYLSGRSAAMYQMGCGLFANHVPPLLSPRGSAIWLLVLDMFSAEHTKQIIDTELLELNEDVKAHLSAALFQLSAGVPRLITYAISFIKHIPRNKLQWQDLEKKLNSSRFLKHILQLPGGRDAIKPYARLKNDANQTNQRRAKLYLKLATWALLRCPIPIDLTISNCHYGYETRTSILQVMRDLSMYVSRVVDTSGAMSPSRPRNLEYLDIIAGDGTWPTYRVFTAYGCQIHTTNNQTRHSCCHSRPWYYEQWLLIPTLQRAYLSNWPTDHRPGAMDKNLNLSHAFFSQHV